MSLWSKSNNTPAHLFSFLTWTIQPTHKPHTGLKNTKCEFSWKREILTGRRKELRKHVPPPFRAGYLSVLVNQMWREQWCCVCRGALHFYHDKGDARTSMASLPLQGCDVVPGLGPKHPFAFRIVRNSTEVAALEVQSQRKCVTQAF